MKITHIQTVRLVVFLMEELGFEPRCAQLQIPDSFHVAFLSFRDVPGLECSFW